MSNADLEWWLNLVPELDWTFAKTMADTPHEYVVRGKTLDEERFEKAVRVIRKYGEPGKFWQHTNIYLVSERSGFRFWTMGEPLAECEIINRAPWDQVYGKQNAPRTFSGIETVYEDLAADYDKRYDTDDCHAEDKIVQRVIREHAGAYAPRVLDIGCGTGLLLDWKVTHPSLYTGVDPSQAMLNEFVRKHRKVTGIIPGRWEDVASKVGQGFELITSLYGVASYIPAASLKGIADRATTGGMTLLMHYKEGYLPDYWTVKPPHLDESREAAARIPGARQFELNNYLVTVIVR